MSSDEPTFWTRSGPPNSEFQYDSGHLHSTFCGLVGVFGLSLRVQEQCFSRIKLAMLATPANHYFYPNLIAGLVVLRVVCPTGYGRFARSDGTAADLLEAIRNRHSGGAFLADQVGTVLACCLLCVNRGQKLDPALEQILKIAGDTNSKDHQKERAVKIAEMRQYMRSHERHANLQDVLSRIELGFQLT